MLAHEIAHIHHNDFLICLGGELTRMLHFYHPLVHWLTDRLRLGRELAADVAAAGLVGGQHAYLKILAELALERERRRLAWPAHSYFPTRNTLVRRIEMLRDRGERTHRPSFSIRVVAVALAATCGLMAVGFRNSSGESDGVAADDGQATSKAVAAEDAARMPHSAGLIVEPTTGLEFRRVQTFSGERDLPVYRVGTRLSPQGSYLRFEGKVVPIYGEGLAELTRERATRFKWSPDERHLAFYSSGVWVASFAPETGRLLGPPTKVLDRPYQREASVKWLPDSSGFRCPEGELVILPDEPGMLPKVTQGTDELTDEQPTLGSLTFRDEDVYYVNQDGKIEKGLGKTSYPRGSHFFSSGVLPGDEWAFLWNGARKWVDFVRVRDAFRVRVPLPGGIGFLLRPSCDGKKLLFYRSSFDWANSVKVVAAGGGEICTPGQHIPHSGYTLRWTTDSRCVVTWGGPPDDKSYVAFPIAGDDPFYLKPVQSPNGAEMEDLSPSSEKVLLVVAQDDESAEYWVADVACGVGKEEKPSVRVFRGHPVRSVAWSPDETHLAVNCKEKVWIWSTDGQPPRQVSDEALRVSHIQWSPDGTRVTWSSRQAQFKSLVQLHTLSENHTRTVLDVDGIFVRSDWTAIAWSPDGQRIALHYASKYEPPDAFRMHTERDRCRSWENM